jgi:hypothetical protein
MLAHDSRGHAPAHAGAEAGHEQHGAHALVAQCAGDPAKLARLLKTAPSAQRASILAEAHKLFGNQFVQQAMHDEHAHEEVKKPAEHGEHAAAKVAHQAQPGAHAHALSAGSKGPIAEMAMRPADGGGSSASFSSSQSAKFSSGDVHISETVTCTVKHGEGAINFDLNGGHLNVGNDHMNLDLKRADAATGKALHVNGASVTVAHNSTQKSSTKVEDGYVGIEYETSWTVKGHHGWTATFAMSTFVGVKPPHHHKHWWQKIPVVSVVTAAVVSAIVAAAGAIIATSPEWGPVVVLAL